MDEEDSQDELINKNTSHGKGKRPATSVPSNEGENSEDGEDSLAGETETEEEEEEDDGSVNGEEEEEEEDSEHEVAEKDLEGAVGAASTDLAGLSSDEDADKCPICLNSFHDQPVATPESCEHYFCLDCILEWAKNANSCPVDRIVFSNIFLRKCYGGKVQKSIMVQKSVKAGQEEQVDLDLEQTNCEVCGGSDREDRLLLCDGCDAGYHMECLTPPLDAVPVEEWFCPECAANNHNTRSERSSEHENSFPTTSHSSPSSSRPTRAIARTQQSERVRANVHRHRITQARTAAQIAPRYLMQSTWLDETINAVVAGLNTAVYVRDLTLRPRSRRRRKTVKKRNARKEGKAAGGKTTSTRVRRRKRKARRTKARKKVVVKDATSRGRIARSLGIKKPVRSSSIPSVYRPCDQTLGSMRADIGAASLSIYGDPFDLDPFDNEEEMQQTPTPSSLMEAKRRGLSRSAMRSHQPVARPISAGLPRSGHGIPQVEDVAEAAPVPDLLGSILSGQSMLLMDSSDVVINRDGSLKATKPVSLSLPRRSSSTSGGTGSTPPTGTSQTTLSSPASPSPSGPLKSQSESHNFPHPCSSPLTPVSASPDTSHSSILGHQRLHTPVPHRQIPSHPAGTEHSQWGTCGVRGQPTTRVTSGASDSRLGERGKTEQPPTKKPPAKPVWVDVSGLPRIPKIKRESSSAVHGSSRSNSNNLPESSMTSLAGDKGRQHTVDQQGASASRQSRTIDTQRRDRTAHSSSFSNSFSAPSSSANVTLNPRPSSSSGISFRINASGNPWHSQRLSLPEQTLLRKDEETAKRAQKDKQMLLLSHSQMKKASVKSEVYDPFNPTGSDSSESEAEDSCSEMDVQSTVSMLPTMEEKEGLKHQIKVEPMDPPLEEASSAKCVQVKKEPDSLNNNPPSHKHMQIQAGSLSAVTAYSESPGVSGAELSETQDSLFIKALDRTTSSSASIHDNDSKIKIEVKAEPEDETPVTEFKLESEVTKGNGVYDEVPSQASCSAVTPKSKEKLLPPCPRLEEEGMQTESVSQSPPFKEFECTHSKKKHSQSEERRRSHSRSPGHRRSLSRSKERRRSHSRSKERRRSRSRSKERWHSHSRSKDRKRSRSRSKERRRSRSRSKERRRSRSRSKEKRDSRSRSNERRYSHSQDRRCSTRSSSNERSRKRKTKRESHERKDGHKRPYEKKHSRSRSRSRSRERKREQPSLHSSSSASRDGDETKRKTKRSRSTSREGKQIVAVMEGSHQKERSTNKTTATIAIKEKEPKRRLTKNTPALKEEAESGGRECEMGTALLPIKKETEPSSSEPSQHSVLNEESKNNTEITTALVTVANKPYETKSKEMKQENILPVDEANKPQLQEDIKREEEEGYELCEGLKKPVELMKEEISVSQVIQRSQEFSDSFSSSNQTSYSFTQESTSQILEAPKEVKLEQIWPDEYSSGDEGDMYSDCALVINLCPTDFAPEDCERETDCDSKSFPVVVKEEMKVEPLQAACQVKQEPVDSSDEDINVDYLIDNLDFIKKEMKDSPVTDPAVPVEPKPVMEEVSAEAKHEIESALVMVGTKAKSQGKRVTWNIQEPEGPQPEKMSKLALFKLKLKQEGSRKTATTSITQSSCEDAAPVQVGLKPAVTNINPPAQEGQSDFCQGGSKSCREEHLQDSHQKDKYMKKLHMQERAIEEVKLAIKPFYQKRDITKEEYKEILRKAVQKVCHSKSGEINPVKVANLVKAYVDKYKHARKHRKGGSSGQTAGSSKDSETPGL